MDERRKIIKLKIKSKDPNAHTTRISWADLPQELLEAIAKHLPTQGHIRHFRAVCKSWRQSIPFSLLPSPLFPLLPLKLSFPQAASCVHLRGKSATLAAFSVCLLRPSTAEPDAGETPHPWLVAVEEVNPGKLYLRRPLSRTLFQKLPQNFPRVLDLSQFDVTEISKGYYFRVDDDIDDMFTKRNLADYKIAKVVLFVNPSCAPNPRLQLHDCTAVLLDHNGYLHAVRLGEERECVPICVPLPFHRRSVYPFPRVVFEDVVSFMGEVYAIDRRGHAYSISYDSLTARVVVDDAPGSVTDRTKRKKWLVESSGRLCLVRRCPGDKVEFELFELDLEGRCWNRGEILGDDWSLFVTFDGCFFLSAEDLPRWRLNRIIFYKGCFYCTSTRAEPDGKIFMKRHWMSTYDIGRELNVATYVLEHGTRTVCRPVSSWDAELLWPPPDWVFPEASPSSSWSSEEGQESESDSHSEHCELNRGESDSHSSSAETGDEEGANSTPLSTPLYTQEQSDPNSVYQREAESVGEPRNDITAKASSSLTEASRTFEKLNIKPDLVSTLRKIWLKHGNVTEGTVISNRDILGRALESLATVVETLQSSSGWSLEDGQADYVSSALSDLKLMRINVDWLVPSVDKALALHRSKPAIKTLSEIDRSKTKARETRMKLLRELEKVKEEEKLLEADRNRVSGTIPVSGEIDMDGCLGDGLC